MSTVHTIYRGFDKEIFFNAKDSDGDPVDISGMTDIRACIGALVLDVGGGGAALIGTGVTGEWKVSLTAAQTTGLTTGKDTIVGQVELGTSVNPIEFTAYVNVKDVPC